MTWWKEASIQFESLYLRDVIFGAPLNRYPVKFSMGQHHLIASDETTSII